MKEPDFDGSSFEQPDAEPEAHAGPGDEGPAEEPTVGETGAREGDGEVLYVRKGMVRRRPKFGTFGVLGGLLGLIVGLVLAQVGVIPAEENYTRVDLSIVLVGLAVPAGILLALLLALILERRSK